MTIIKSDLCFFKTINYQIIFHQYDLFIKLNKKELLIEIGKINILEEYDNILKQ